jgi:hypothetical protein
MLLGFTKDYIEPILTGAKTTTLRRSRPNLAPGDVFGARCRYTDPPFALLRVVRVESVAVSGLTSEDAARDGFSGIEHLRQAIARLYPNQDLLWRVVFERVE